MDNGSGLYFDPMGRVKISKEPLFVATFVNISDSKTQLELMKVILRDAKVSCAQIEALDMGDSFTGTIILVETLLRSCETQFDNIRRKRNKRCSFMNFMGDCASGGDVSKLGDKIDNIQDRMREQSSVYDKNFLFIASEMKSKDGNLTDLKDGQISIKKDLKKVRDNIIKNEALSLETRKKLEKQEVHLNNSDEKIEKIEAVLNQFKIILDNNRNVLNLHDKQIQELNLRLKMSKLLENVNKELQLIMNRLGEVSNAIAFTRSDTLHTSVISHETVLKELAKNVDQISYSSELPYHPVAKNIQKILDLSKVKYTVEDDIVIFVLRIPLISKLEFIAYNVYPMPISNVSNSDTFVFLQPNKKHSCLALSRDKLQYTFIDSLESCRIIEDSKYFCESESVYSTSEFPTCETQLLTGSSPTMPTECDPRVVKGTIDIWHKLKNKQWIFVQSKHIRLTVDCGPNKVKEVRLIGSGVLNVPGNCSARTVNQQFIAKEESGTVLQQPEVFVRILDNDCCTTAILNTTVADKKSVNLKASDLSSIEYESHSISIANKPPTLEYYFPYIIIGSALLLLLLLLVLTGVGCYCCCRKYKKGSKSTDKDEERPNIRASIAMDIMRFMDFANNKPDNEAESTNVRNIDQIKETKKTTPIEINSF